MRAIAIALFLVAACEDSKKEVPAQAATEDAQSATVLPTDAALPSDALASPVDATVATVDAKAAPAGDSDTGKTATKTFEKESNATGTKSSADSARQKAHAWALWSATAGPEPKYLNDTDQGAGLDTQIRDVKRSNGKRNHGASRRGPISDNEPPAKPQPVSRVRFTVDAIDETTLGEDQVSRRVRSRYLAGIKRCHVRRLKADPRAGGRVRAKITIRSSGRTGKSSVVGFDGTVDKCIKGLIKKWRFEVPKDGGKATSATFVLTFLLKSGG